VIYISNRAGGPDAYVHAADGTAADSLLLDLGGNILVAQIAPDGWIIAETGAAGKRDLIAMRPGVDTLRFLSEPYNEMQPALSPDGHWLAYVSDESGRDEVIVRPFPNLADNSWQVSTHGGSSPVWSHSGRELFFENEAREMVSQEVVPGPVFRPGAQRVLFTIGSAYRMEALMTDFDVSPDDQRFLMVRATSPETHSATSTLNVAENWIQDVKRMVREGQ
jgi:Tol biopolymer transport system component